MKRSKRKRKRKKTPGGNPSAPSQPGQGQPNPGQQQGTGTPQPSRNWCSDYITVQILEIIQTIPLVAVLILGTRPGSAAPGGPKEEPTEKEIQDQIKATLARLSGAGKSGKFAQRAKFRRQKRDDVASTAEEAAMERANAIKSIKGYEFVTANELAT